MDENKDNFRCVFLIDSSLGECPCNKTRNASFHLNEIIACVMRTLSYFEASSRSINKNHSDSDIHKNNILIQHSSKEKDSKINDQPVKWGFKLFSTGSTLSRKTTSGSSSSEFQSCKLQHFENLVHSLQCSFEDVTENSLKRRSLSKPAEALSQALNEVLHDFLWQTEDFLGSPVRSSSRGKGKVSSKEDSENERSTSKKAVFILGKSPRNKKMFRLFSNKVVMDSDVFIDSFMSPALQQEFRDKFKITLSWIDLSSAKCRSANESSQSEDESLLHSVLLMKESMSKLGGFFAPQHLILQDIPTDMIQDGFEVAHYGQVLSAQSHLMSLRNGQNTDLSFPKQDIFINGKTISCNSTRISSLKSDCDPEDKSGVSKDSNHLSSLKDSNHLSSLKDSNHLSSLTVLGCLLKAQCGLSWLQQLKPTSILCCQASDKMSLFFKGLLVSKTYAILCTKESILAVLSPCTQEVAMLSVLWCPNMKRKTSEILRMIKPLQYKHISKDSTPLVKDSHVYRTSCLNAWHMPGTSADMGATVGGVLKRSQDARRSDDQKSILRSLRLHYARERQPQELIPPSVSPSFTSTPLCGPPRGRLSHSGGSDSQSSSSMAGLSRGRLMLERAKSASQVAPDDLDLSAGSHPGSPGRRASESFGWSSALLDMNIESEAELVEALVQQYQQVIHVGVALETSLHSLVTLTSRFMAHRQDSNPQKSAVAFLREHLILKSSALKDKYINKFEDEDIKEKVTEYKLQILLLLEMESLLLDNDPSALEELTTELTSMLRALSFTTGPASLQDFMKDFILPNYATSLGEPLLCVYDELMLPLPPALERLTSPGPPSSVWGPPSIGEDSLLTPGSSQPASNSSGQGRRSVRLKAHPSFSDFGQNQKKQILVKPQIVVKPKAELKTSKSAKRKSTKESSKTEPKPTQKRKKVEQERARKNLFCDAGEKQTSRSHHHSKPSSESRRHGDRSRHLQSKRSKSHSRSTSRPSKHSLNISPESKVLVPGTPSRNQTSRRHLALQEKKRVRHNVLMDPDVMAVAESPIKDEALIAPSLRPAQYLVREAFYSSSSQPSRNLARSMEVGGSHALTGSQRPQSSLASAVRGESPFLSPGRRLMRSLLASPSPEHRARPTPASKSPGTPTRRAHRRSVKKLDFTFRDCPTATRKSPGKNQRVSTTSLDPTLIFDGENASDINMFKSPVKQFVPKSPFKTPEKGKSSFRHLALMQAASCPPGFKTPPKRFKHAQLTPELSFRNVLSTTANAGKFVSPRKDRGAGFVLSSPERALRFGSNMNPSSPAKNHQSVSDLSKRALRSVFDESLSSPHKGTMSPSKARLSQLTSESSPRKVQPMSILALGTPDKPGRHSSKLVSTPSKVTFSRYDLVSPPPGGCPPPAAEATPGNSTPGKSILKTKSPGFKNKAMRRVELTAVDPASCKKNSSFMDKLTAAEEFIVEGVNNSKRDEVVDQRFNTVPVSSSKNTQGLISNQVASTSVHLVTSRSLDSSDEDSSELRARSANHEGVTIIRTPSPGSKPRTPESINTWNRRKRLAGSKYSSSSSSSPNLSQTYQVDKINQPSAKPVVGQVSNFAGLNLCKDNEHSRKRNIALLDSDVVSESPRKKARRSLNIKSQQSCKENMQLFSLNRQATGDFNPCSREPSAKSEDNELFSVSKSSGIVAPIKEQDLSLGASGDASTNRTPSIGFYQPICSPITTDSCEWFDGNQGGGSQGFQVAPNLDGKKRTQIDSSELDHNDKDNKSKKSELVGGHNKSPKQYSPSLTSSGLMHLINSPLIAAQSKDGDKHNRGRSTKTRKHLDI